MNANEARSISLQNSSKFTEALFTRSINEIDSVIRDQAKAGNFKAVFQTVLIEPTVKAHIVERIKEHYESKGFNVEVSQYIFAVRVTISWDLEGEGFY